RIQIIRERTGKSRAVVAGLVGRSTEWLKAVEKCRRQPPRLDMLVRLAEVLGVRDLAELTGEGTVEMGLRRRNGHPVVASIRDAIDSAQLTMAPEPIPNTIELLQRTEYAWKLWHTSPTPRATAGAVLPQLIRDGRRAVRILNGTARRQAYAA